MNLQKVSFFHFNRDRLRIMSYSSTDVFVVCFSVVEPSSFLNIAEKWAPEIRQYMPNIPWILVGTQIDLRDDAVTIKDLGKKRLKPISKEDGKCKNKDNV
jgi:GTPase SAR1 family protein